MTAHDVPRGSERTVTKGRTVADQRIRLVVRGRLWPSLVASLDGFVVDQEADGLTSLVGSTVDQSHLLGLLELLASMRVEVVSVNPIE